MMDFKFGVFISLWMGVLIMDIKQGMIELKWLKYFVFLVFVIIMNKSPTVPQNLFLSPIFRSQEDNSPYLSPFRNPFRKLSAGFEDLINFRLEDPLYPANQIDPSLSQIPQQHPILQKENRNELLAESCLEFQEAASPNDSHHCEIPSTKFAQIRQESQPPFFQLRASLEGASQVQAMIEFLIEHSHQKEGSLQIECIHFSEGNRTMQRAFQILAGKFKKLRKTKQQMIKYCMRKAFKFIAQYTRNDRSKTRDLDNCMKEYFEDANQGNFTIPFKKHSTQKTMNGNFLKRVFSCEQFCQDYKIFLSHFQSLVIQDNEKKIRYLANLVEEAVQKDDPESINKIKRLPWTRQILQKVFDLGISLSQNPQQSSRQLRHLNE